MDGSHRLPVTRPAGRFREVEHRVQTVSLLGEGGCILPYVQGVGRECQLGLRHDPLSVNVNIHREGNGRQHRQGPPSRTGRKRGTQSQAIGRSRGGITSKIMALTDALGNLIDFRLLPRQAYDLRGTAALIKGPDLRPVAR